MLLSLGYLHRTVVRANLRALANILKILLLVQRALSVAPLSRYNAGHDAQCSIAVHQASTPQHLKTPRFPLPFMGPCFEAINSPRSLGFATTPSTTWVVVSLARNMVPVGFRSQIIPSDARATIRTCVVKHSPRWQLCQSLLIS